MKRFLIAVTAVLTLAAAYAQLYDLLPITVHRFLLERDMQQQMKDNGTQPSSMMHSPFAPTRMINGIEMIDAFIGVESKGVTDVLRRQGVIINCEFDGFVTAQIPVDLLAKVSKLPGVTDMEISGMVELCTDSTLSVTRAGEVIHGTEFGLPQAYDGSGVIIGIIDSGFDYKHLAFRCADDTSRCRIVRLYDPLDTTGHVVNVGINTLPGSVLMGEQIDTLTTDGTSTHGTHTASIAAGMHVNGYGGMAPGADIVLCNSRTLSSSLSEVEVVNCLRYIYAYADSVGKPCVVSLSVSKPNGPHDGSDRISTAVSQLVGPGKIFVIAAGNTANGYYYSSGPATVDKSFNMLIGAYNMRADDNYYYNNFWMDTWVRTKGVRPLVKFHIFDWNTRRIVWESDYITGYKRFTAADIGQYFAPDTTVSSDGYMYALVALSSTGKYEIQTFFYNLKNQEYTIDEYNRYVGRYQIGVSIYPPKMMYASQSDSCYVDSWVCGGTGRRTAYPYPYKVYFDEISEDGDTLSTVGITNYYAMPSDDASIGTYAVHDSVISAGAYVGRNTYPSYYYGLVEDGSQPTVGAIYSVSSFQTAGVGPTGEALPTVTAPGHLVVSAVSRYSYFNTYPGYKGLIMKTDDGSVWGIMSGTSMAAPTVAGIIAQWLQIDPNLSPSDVKNIIAQTAIKDAFTQDLTYGGHFGPNGKIDAMAGVRYLLGLHEDDIMKGDVDGDGLINIADIVLLINYVLRGDPEGIVMTNIDMDENEIIDVADVVLLIDYVLRYT